MLHPPNIGLTVYRPPIDLDIRSPVHRVQYMTQTAETPPSISPDDALPDVEPPSAGFILQLFVIPAVIVAIIVAVWLMFNWLAHMGDNPDTYVRALARDNDARWQAAVNLANALRRPNSELRTDPRLAGQLSQILKEDLAQGAGGNEVDLRVKVYLCRALGEFEIPDGVPTLLEVARTQSSEALVPVRCSAIEALALLASGPVADAVKSNPQVAPVLVDASRAEDVAVRTRAAFALGVVGGTAAEQRLEQMLVDLAPDARYNAATGLARLGNPAAISVLTEMLDPAAIQIVEHVNDEAGHQFKRPVILQNALKATEKLAKINPTANLQPLQSAAERLAESDADPGIRQYARQVAKELAARPASSSAQSTRVIVNRSRAA